MILLEVAVTAPVMKTYSYILPERAEKKQGDTPGTLAGRRVQVPFGARRVTGYVLGLSTTVPFEHKLKEIDEFLDDEPLFHETIIPVLRWVAEYYHYPIGEVIKASLPGGLTVRQKKIVVLTKGGREKLIQYCQEKDLAKAWVEDLVEKEYLSPSVSSRVFAKEKKLFKELERRGCVAVASKTFRERVREKNEICYTVTEEILKQINGGDTACVVLKKQLGKAEKKTLDLILKLAEKTHESAVPRRELTMQYPYSATILPKLEAKGMLRSFAKRVYRTPFGELLPKYHRPLKLTAEQSKVLAGILPVLDERRFNVYLLNGVTGSGKTEVYLRAAQRAIDLGRGVLVLVPEIALATQVEAHFVARFGDKVALLHSGLSPGEKYDEWSRICAGEACVVIGARSAVFAPLKDIGLIIVDEEHDSSFKQEDRLRYNSRDIAVVRAKKCNAAVILGSATPSITSYKHAVSGKYTHLQMKTRVGGRKLPKVTVIDLKKYRENNGTVFNQELRQALVENLEQGSQSILLLNRRGFAASMICKDCGTIVECRHCKVTLNLHKKKNRLICHYCGFSLPANLLCNCCGSANLAPVGFGTERVEEEVKSLLPHAKVARIDSDIASDRGKFIAILQKMKDRQIDILVGTQMIAKGLHFPGVSLVGVVWADGGLAFPDYRAAEKTYQLIAQVTGRAGRGSTEGKVIIQTMQPEHYAIAFASSHNYSELAEKELRIRCSAGFPPFVRLVSIKIEGKSEQRVREVAGKIRASARYWCSSRTEGKGLEILGPAPSPIEKIRDRYRWHILIKGKDLGEMHKLVDHLQNIHCDGNNQEKIIIDIDPENML